MNMHPVEDPMVAALRQCPSSSCDLSAPAPVSFNASKFGDELDVTAPLAKPIVNLPKSVPVNEWAGRPFVSVALAV